MLVEALRRFEDSVCKGCGHSAFLTYDRHENTQSFKHQTVVCVACEPLEAAARVRKDDEWPGTKNYVINTMGQEPEAT